MGSPFERLFAETGLLDLVGGPEALAKGLAQIWAELARAGFDASAAAVRGIDLADAAEDFDNFRDLARVHSIFEDILQMALPAELVEWGRRVLAMPTEPPMVGVLREQLVARAIHDPKPSRRAVCRVLLFEGVRFNLLVHAKRQRGRLAGVGVSGHDLSVLAEREMNVWLAARPRLPPDIRPFEVIVAGALKGLLEHAADAHREMARVNQEVVAVCRRRADLDEALCDADSADALLIRNYFSDEIQEQRLSVKLLRGRHPLVLGDVQPAAIYQRVGRFSRRLASGRSTWPRRESPALIDLIEEAESAADTRPKKPRTSE
jgi:hypothetical protein